MRVQWAGEEFELLVERAAWWPARRALVVADVHFGKSDHFRAAGVPVPTGSTEDALTRLERAVASTQACEVIVLGDLFHARGGVSDEMVERVSAWRASRPGLVIRLVTGNHDRHAGPPPASFGMIEEGDELVVGDLVLRHDPVPMRGKCVMAGHIHPGVRLYGAAGHRMKLPCFHFGKRVAVLPAFGSFTGTHPIRPREGDGVYAVGPGKVVQIDTTARVEA